MAPEVGANLLTICEYDHSVDIWSIGCVFYQSYVGKVINLIPKCQISKIRYRFHLMNAHYADYFYIVLVIIMKPTIYQICLKTHLQTYMIY